MVNLTKPGTTTSGTLFTEQHIGSDATGVNADINRVLTTSVSSASGTFIVFLDSQHLRRTDNYTVSGNDITFLIRVFDSQKIDIYYIT